MSLAIFYRSPGGVVVRLEVSIMVGLWLKSRPEGDALSGHGARFRDCGLRQKDTARSTLSVTEHNSMAVDEGTEG